MKQKVLAIQSYEILGLVTQQHSVTFQKTWIFSNTAVTTSDHTKMKCFKFLENILKTTQ